jgi:hypothetical protein
VAGCPAWFRNVEPTGRRQACLDRIVKDGIVLLACIDSFSEHYLDPCLD